MPEQLTLDEIKNEIQEMRNTHSDIFFAIKLLKSKNAQWFVIDHLKLTATLFRERVHARIEYLRQELEK